MDYVAIVLYCVAIVRFLVAIVTSIKSKRGAGHPRSLANGALVVGVAALLGAMLLGS